MTILKSPIKIGTRLAPNRIVNQPMEGNDADEIGNPTELTLRRYFDLAKGGAGVIFIEALAISDDCRARKNQLAITLQTAPAIEKMIRGMKKINAESLILLQLTHSGRNSLAGVSKPVAAYPAAQAGVHVLSEREIEEIGDGFAEAAGLSEKIGADGLDFKQCHGYFCAEVLRPANTRKDRFGGSFENRIRFFREAAEKIKEKIKGDSFVLGTRFSAYEGIPGGFGTGGAGEVIEDLSESRLLARVAEDLGFHFLNVSGGISATTPEIVRPTRLYPEGVFRLFGWSKAIKNEVSIPVIGSGYSLLRDGKNELKEPDPLKKSFSYWAGKNLQEGVCDFVGIGRQSFADPLFAEKMLNGNEAAIAYCQACGGCSALLRHQTQVGCAVYNDFYREKLRGIKKAAA
jgi:2,4-dienoyl-CoA reductase-like NADH-dependent reductase (Old Yellow Enzyme family)